VSLELLRMRDFVRPVLGRVLASIASGGILFLLPFYLELTKGLRVEQSSLVLMLYSAILMAIAPLAGRIADRHAPRTICSLAMLAASVACLLFSGSLHLSGLGPVIIFICWVAVTYGFFFPSNNLLILRAIPPELLGSGAGILATAWTLGISLGVSLFEAAFDLRVTLAGFPLHAHDLTAIPPPALLPGFRTSVALGALFSGMAMLFCLRSARQRSGSTPAAWSA
jgi:MFS family permease